MGGLPCAIFLGLRPKCWPKGKLLRPFGFNLRDGNSSWINRIDDRGRTKFFLAVSRQIRSPGRDEAAHFRMEQARSEMESEAEVEHFVTIFDRAFLLSGLTLRRSLRQWSPNSHLWVVALDEFVGAYLEWLKPAGLSVVALWEVENQALLNVKPGRTIGEYSWTLTSFLPLAVMKRVPGARRVTYIDADLFFFSSPDEIFAEFEESGKSVLITEHAFAPEYERARVNGIFCVQFMIFNNDESARKVLRWWQERCLEWCFARAEDGKYGDQKYLDSWPERFASSVHVLRQKSRTLAPWNVDYMLKDGRVNPIFYHFQGFRILRVDKVKLYHGYRINRRNLWIYDAYLKEMRAIAVELTREGIAVVSMPEHGIALPRVRRLVMTILSMTRIVKLRPSLGFAD